MSALFFLGLPAAGVVFTAAVLTRMLPWYLSVVPVLSAVVVVYMTVRAVTGGP